jgi:hypothetical protein
MFAPTLVGRFASRLVTTDALNFEFTGGMTDAELADYLVDEFDAFVGGRFNRYSMARARRVAALATKAVSEAYRPIRWRVSGWHVKRG